jgi:hypothetical protein
MERVSRVVKVQPLHPQVQAILFYPERQLGTTGVVKKPAMIDFSDEGHLSTFTLYEPATGIAKSK